MKNNDEFLANAILNCLISPNVSDSNLEPANVVDVINRLASSIFELARAIRETKKGNWL